MADGGAIAFFTFAIGLAISALSTIRRAVRFRVMGWRLDDILKRDLAWQLGVGTSMGLILFARAANLGEVVRGQVWWILATSIPAVAGVLVYAYFELFVIESTLQRELPMSIPVFIMDKDNRLHLAVGAPHEVPEETVRNRYRRSEDVPAKAVRCQQCFGSMTVVEASEAAEEGREKAEEE